MMISRECGRYDPHNKATKWLKEHAGQGIEIIGSDEDSGLMKVFRVRSLADGTVGTAWERELVK